MKALFTTSLLGCYLLCLQSVAQGVVISGELKKWHKVTLTFDSGISTSETDTVNPFTDYRLNITFTNGAKTYLVPGYYAADGDAANTNAGSGAQWRVHFSPDETGTWDYQVSFRTGSDIAVSDDADAGVPVSSIDGLSGSLYIQPTDKTASDFRAKGRLQYTGDHQLRFAETGEYFLKGGAGSPENFLAYWEFDGTYDDGGVSTGLPSGLHHYDPHAGDWHTGDPTWQNGKGKGIIGALNYLASEGVNSLYFLTMNIDGDGDDVWPYISPDVANRERFDVSKLAQWELVFQHMDSLGIALHIFTSEREDQMLLDNGNVGNLRKLYYRELIARFSHHLAILWNLGEENGRPYLTRGAQNDQQRKDMAAYFKTHDPYKNFVTVHNYTPDVQRIYTPLLGYPNLDGISLQAYHVQVNNITTQWRNNSSSSGHRWVIFHDETVAGVDPDGAGNNQAVLRRYALWGNLMGGGGGVDWYFDEDDLNAENFRTRSGIWKYTRYALQFFHSYLPFWEMSPNDNLTSSPSDYVLELPGEVYAIYLPYGNSTIINLPAGDYTVRWYSPVNGGSLVNGSLTTITGGKNVSFGNPPSSDSDWVALLTANTIINCDDDDLCTVDIILNGQCSHPPVACNDNNPCTNNLCNLVTGCFYTQVVCNDFNACTNDLCNPLTGCTYTAVDCNDFNACTTDNCNPQTGCVYISTLNCNDNNPCTADSCENGSCIFHPIPGCCFSDADCDDLTACTGNYCSNNLCYYFNACVDQDDCTQDTCINGICHNMPLHCDDNNTCTRDFCANAQCIHDTVYSLPSYLKVINHNQSWRKLKLGYSPVSLWQPKVDVVSGGNDTLCITLRDQSGDADWNKLQLRPQGNSDYAVTLGDYLPPDGVGVNWTDLCIPLQAFGSFPFTQISFLEIPYSDGAAPFELHIQRIEFTGGATPFLWFGDPHTNNYHDGQSGSSSALTAVLVPGQTCNALKMLDRGQEQPLIAEQQEAFLTAFPNPFKDQVTISFRNPAPEIVRIELTGMDGRLIETLFEGTASDNEIQSVEFKPGSLSNGMYFYRMIAASGRSWNRKLLLLK